MHMSQPPRTRAARGFTLIELMIVVAIVGILGSLAYPAYLDSVRKGRRAEGRTALMELLQQQERYMTQRNTYMCWVGSGCSSSAATAAQTFKLFSGDRQANAAYTLDARVCDSPNDQIKNCVRLVATPTRPDPETGNLWIESLGLKGCENGSKPSLCWK